MAGVPRRKPARTALPDEAAWLAERERLDELDQADAAAAAGDDESGDQRPAGAPTPKGAPAGSGGSLPRPTLKLPSRPSGGDLGAFLLGFGMYALFLNFLHYGPVGVKGWLMAKFINSPLDPGELASAETSSSIDTGPVAPLSQGA